jgi:hypothetical protein
VHVGYFCRLKQPRAVARGIGYSITTHIGDGFETSRIVWDDAPVDVTADEALADYANSIKAASTIGKAKE